jgi:hypothetical protein
MKTTLERRAGQLFVKDYLRIMHEIKLQIETYTNSSWHMASIRHR